MYYQGRGFSPKAKGTFFLEQQLHRVQVWQIGMYKLY